MSIDVIKVELGRENLLAMQVEETELFIAIGHITNEINAITMLMYWASSAPQRNDAEIHGQETMLLILLRILAGKSHEAWEFYRKRFLSSEIGKEYAQKLQEDLAPIEERVKKYFGKKNAASLIRNNFGFHYNVENMEEVIRLGDNPLLVYLNRKTVPNNLFHFSEKLIGERMLTMLQDEGFENQLDKLAIEIMNYATAMSDLLSGVLISIMDNVHELRVRDPEDVEFEELQPFNKITLPWFADTQNAKNG